MTKKQLLIGAGIFLAGMVMSPKGTSPQAPTNSAQVETIVASDSADLKAQMIKLRDTDNKVFILAGTGMTACSDMLSAIQEGDVEKLESQTDLLNSVTDNVNLLKAERDVILIEAGIPNEQ